MDCQPPSLEPECIEQMRANAYLTNDCLWIFGGTGSINKYIRINGVNPFALSLGEFMVVAILAAHSLTMADQPTPRRIDGNGWMSAKELRDAIDVWLGESKGCGRVDSDICHIIYKFRKRLRDLGLNPNLIETGQFGSGNGYRLSTLAVNIKLTIK